MDTYLYSGSQRSWTYLPFEILTFIAIRLPLLDLLSFRGTCKDFRSASSTATAKIQSSKTPWLLLHKYNGSKCILYNKDQSKTYNLKIPDLDGAICLASYQGWLLLFKNESMYFFSPFSGNKITLPEFPHKQVNSHVGAFSHAPTSPDCIISIINPIESPTEITFEINVLSRGQSTWTKHMQSEFLNLLPPVSGATFDHKTRKFYYIRGTKSVLTFSVKDNKWKPYNVVSGKDANKDTEFLPYASVDNMFQHTIDDDQKMKQLLDLEDDEYVDVCGLTFEYDNNPDPPIVYKNETVNVSSTNKTRMCKAVWIEPRFYEVHQDNNQHW